MLFRAKNGHFWPFLGHFWPFWPFWPSGLRAKVSPMWESGGVGLEAKNGQNRQK